MSRAVLTVVDGGFNPARPECLTKRVAVIALVGAHPFGPTAASANVHRINRANGGSEVVEVRLGGDGRER